MDNEPEEGITPGPARSFQARRANRGNGTPTAGMRQRPPTCRGKRPEVRRDPQNDQGLINQGWKDSWDGINFADGTLAEPPIALCEVHAYVYVAYLSRAWLAYDDGDMALGNDLTNRAPG